MTDPAVINPRVKEILRKITPCINKGDLFIDIGSGSCEVARSLSYSGLNIQPIDVVNKSIYNDLTPLIYDGKKLPFADNSFDVALLITVLHHTNDPIGILREARRVAPKVIVMEDLHTNIFQKYLTFAMDSFTNKEYIGHPHTNKTEKEWLRIFSDLGLEVQDSNIHNFWRFFISGTFILKRK